MPTAEMMTGTIIGEIRIAMMVALAGKLARARPSAASVPSAVARMVVAMATRKLIFTAPDQRGLKKKSSYHLSEKPGIG